VYDKAAGLKRQHAELPQKSNVIFEKEPDVVDFIF